MENTLKEITLEFDRKTGELLLALGKLKNMNTALGRVSDDIENTDLQDQTAMALQFHEMRHKILMVSDLLRYTVNDLESTYEDTNTIKESYFDLLVRGKGNKGSHEYAYYENIEDAVKSQAK